MNGMIIGTSWIFGTWILIVLPFLGIGLMIQNQFKLKKQNIELSLSAFWVGWSFVIVVLQLWHFLAPVEFTIHLIIISVGLISMLLNIKNIGSLLRKQKQPLVKVLLMVPFGLFALWMANQAMAGIMGYDTGLYHLSAIRWATSYAIVPGLGNLHRQLAFNSSYFLFAALLDVGPWSKMSQHLTNGVILFVISLQIWVSVSKIIINRGRVEAYHVLNATFMVPIIYKYLWLLSSIDTDLPIFILGIVVSVEVCKLLFSPITAQEALFSTFLIIFVSTIGIAIKLSFLVMGGLCSVIALWKLATYRDQLQDNSKKLICLLLPTLLVLLPWVGRGIILSGYPIYPVHYLSVNVEWKLPERGVMNEARWIKSWAQKPRTHPDEVLADWSWLTPWMYSIYPRHFWDVIFPLLCLLFIGLPLMAYRGYRKEIEISYGFLFLLPGIAGIIFWFFTAPDPRFAGAVFWYLGAGAVAIGFARYSKMSFLILFFSLGLITFKAIDLEKPLDLGLIHEIHPISQIETTPFTTKSGLILNKPATGNQCWDAPLPCTPYPNAKLRLREDGNLGSGFIRLSEN